MNRWRRSSLTTSFVWGRIARSTALLGCTFSLSASAQPAFASSESCGASAGVPGSVAEVRRPNRADGKVSGSGDHAFEHDGFFARAEIGIALTVGRIAPPSASSGRTATEAWGQSSQVLVGGTPWPGLVVGGLLGAARLDPTFIEKGRRKTPNDDSVKVNLVRIGPFVDWYPNPRRGFHTQLAVAFAVEVESDLQGDPIEPGATGPAASFGVGQEWFLSRSFSLGVFGRLTFARLQRTRHPGGAERTLWEGLELGLSSTFH